MRKGILLVIFLSLFSVNSVLANDCTDNALSRRMSCDSQARNGNDKIACKNEHIVAVQICANKQTQENISIINSEADKIKSYIENQNSDN